MDRNRGRRRDAEGKIQSNRPERSPSLQRRHEEARLLRRADPRRLRPLSYLEIADREGRYELGGRSEEHTSELQSRGHLVCRLLLEKKKKQKRRKAPAKKKKINKSKK